MNKKIPFFTMLLLFLVGCYQQSTEIPPTVTATEPIPTTTRTPIPRPIQTRKPTCLDRASFNVPAESPYLLPYPVGKRYYVDQNYCQVDGSHRNQLAYDFAMEFGDLVTAVRAGRVAEIVESYADTDTDSSHFNYLFIIHKDATVAFYAHLMKDGIFVEPDDIVEAGQAIAQVGHSGMPADYKSVLHFGVYAGWPPIEGQDVPVTFRNASGVLDSRNGLARSHYEALP